MMELEKEKADLERQIRILKWCLGICIALIILLLSPFVRYKYINDRYGRIVCIDRLTGNAWRLTPRYGWEKLPLQPRGNDR
jgi:hypothetical protein